MANASNERNSIWTVGHSTLTIEQFLGVLSSFQIELLVDVRSFPGSRRYPHFNKEELRRSSTAAGIGYAHMPELGGRRKTRPDSQNVAWRNESFRGYADYMETNAFNEGIDRLLEFARERRTAVMCAEAVWWRCHRRIVTDHLIARGETVFHIMGRGRVERARLTPGAVVQSGYTVVYPGC